MSDYNTLAVLTGCLFIGGPIAHAITSFLLHGLRARRAQRNGWTITLGITGKPADLKAQHDLIDELHRSANLVSGRPNVVAFPGAAARLRRGGESA